MTSLLHQPVENTPSGDRVTLTGKRLENRTRSLGLKAALAVSAILTAAISGTTGAGIWLSTRGLVRQAEETGRTAAITAATRFGTLQNASAANVARSLDIVLDDELRALAAGLAMLVEAAETDQRTSAYIHDALRQLTARSMLRRIDIVAPEGANYSTAAETPAMSEIESTFQELANAPPQARTATTDTQQTPAGLTKKAGAQATHRRLAVRVEQALDGESATTGYGEPGNQRSRSLAQEQTQTVARVLTHAIELAEDSGWGRGRIEQRLQQIIDNTSIQRIEAMGASGPPIYQRNAETWIAAENQPAQQAGSGTPAGNQNTQALQTLREGNRQMAVPLPGRYDQQRQWISSAAANRGNQRLTVSVEIATQAGDGGLVQTAWQTETDQMAAVDGVEGIWVAVIQGEDIRLAAAAPRRGHNADGTQDAWNQWNSQTEAIAAETSRSGMATSRANMRLWQESTEPVRSAAPIGPRTENGQHAIVVIESNADAASRQLREEAATGFALAGAMIAVLAIGTSWTMRRWLTDPVVVIAESARALANGTKPPTRLEALHRRNDEIGVLSRGFAKMTSELLAKHDELEQRVDEKTHWLREANERLTDAQTRIERDLDLAKTVQGSLVPTGTHQSGRMSLSARMTPAKDLGGDFVTIGESGKRHIIIAVCDVSGKGVAAALFMVWAQGALTAAAKDSQKVSEIARQTNKALCQGNELGMFVTGIVGRLDTQTGDLEYVNAGHEPAIAVNADGSLSKTPPTAGIPFGLEEDESFATAQTRIEPGTSLIIYTDGITDACNPEEEDYGEERLQNLLQQNANHDAPQIIHQMWTSIELFSRGAAATDDKTCLVIQNPE